MMDKRKSGPKKTKPSKGATEYGQTIEKRGKKLPNTPPPDSWKPKELPEGVRDKQHGVQNPPKEDQKGQQKKQPGQQY